MFCAQCGTALAESSRFCDSCGAARNPEARPITVKNPYIGKDQMMFGYAVILGAWVLGGLAMAAGWMGLGITIALAGTIAGAVVHSVGKFRHWYHAE